MLFRTPLTPLVSGVLLDFRSAACSRSRVCSAALRGLDRRVGRRRPRVRTARRARDRRGACSPIPGYALMFHELASETVFAAAFALWALLLTRAAVRAVARRASRSSGSGSRCSHSRARETPCSSSSRSSRSRSRRLAAAARMGRSHRRRRGPPPRRVGGAQRPSLRRLHARARRQRDHPLLPRVHHGPHRLARRTETHSRRLGRAVEKHLLTSEPYRSYGVTLDDVFESGSFRIHEDLYLLSDQVFGWDSDYAILRGAGIEGVRQHPGTYASGVLETVWSAAQRVVSSARSHAGAGAAKPAGEEKTVVVDGRRLPAPTEGQPIPAGQVVWISRPDNAIRQVWTSPTEWHLEFDHPADKARFDRVQRRASTSSSPRFPDRAGNADASAPLEPASRWYPRPCSGSLLG